MGLFDFITKNDKEQNKILARLVTIAEVGISIFNDSCKPTTSKHGQFEVFMFNVIYCWIFYTERRILNPTKSIINKKILYLHIKAKEYNINISEKDFIKLYEKRYVDITNELALLRKSDYPNTKQYFPAYIFSIIYYNQLELTPDYSDLLNYYNSGNQNINLEAERKTDELSTFTGKFQMYLNSLLDFLEK